MNLFTKSVKFSNIQQEFLRTMAESDNITKNVLIEGQVGSGKTSLGIEVLRMKVEHYLKKFNIEEGTLIQAKFCVQMSQLYVKKLIVRKVEF